MTVAGFATARALRSRRSTVEECLGSPQSDQVRELKLLQDDNARLKKLVAALSLDQAIQQDINSKTGSGSHPLRLPAPALAA
jgi:hypothetical protein